MRTTLFQTQLSSFLSVIPVKYCKAGELCITQTLDFRVYSVGLNLTLVKYHEIVY